MSWRRRVEYAGVGTTELRVDGRGPTVILLHGFAHPADCWSQVLDAFERAGQAAVAVDLPGFGEADLLRPGPRLPQLVRFVGAVVEAHSLLTPVVLVGNSLGAATALCLIDERRDLPVSGLVAMDTACGQWTPMARLALGSRLDLRALPQSRWGARTTDGVAARLLYGDHRQADPDMVRLLTGNLGTRQARRDLSALALGLAREVGAAAKVRDLPCPAVFVHGARDRIVPVVGSIRLHVANPGSRLVVLPGIGHCPHLDAADTVAGLALELAAETDSRTETAWGRKSQRRSLMARRNKTPTDLTGAVIAITGGARGIGRCTAEAFLAGGAKVVIGDVDVDLVEKTAAELALTEGAEVVGLRLDVTDRTSFAAFLDQVEETFGPLDVLVNNAGIMPTGLYAEESDAMTDRMVDINVHGVLTGSKLAAQRFLARGSGHIVNVASLAGVNPAAALATYCGTKHFVIGFTESLHRELAGHGIGVTAVLPGVVRTELSAGAHVPKWAEGLSTVDPEDIAATIVAVVGTRTMRATCPKALAGAMKFSSLLPERGRLGFERLTKFDQAFTAADPAARAMYHARLTDGE